MRALALVCLLAGLALAAAQPAIVPNDVDLPSCESGEPTRAQCVATANCLNGGAITKVKNSCAAGTVCCRRTNLKFEPRAQSLLCNAFAPLNCKFVDNKNVRAALKGGFAVALPIPAGAAPPSSPAPTAAPSTPSPTAPGAFLETEGSPADAIVDKDLAFCKSPTVGEAACVPGNLCQPAGLLKDVTTCGNAAAPAVCCKRTSIDLKPGLGLICEASGNPKCRVVKCPAKLPGAGWAFHPERSCDASAAPSATAPTAPPPTRRPGAFLQRLSKVIKQLEPAQE